MSNNKKMTTTGKPKVEGAVSVAPIGSKLPTDATTPLDQAFKALGYVSEDGLSNSRELDSGNVKAWGGDNVLNHSTFSGDTFSLTLLEVLNVEVLKAVYGDEAVTGTLTDGITVTVGNAEPKPQAWVFDMLLNGGAVKRIVIPEARITDLGEISYTDDDAVGYQIELSCEPNAKGTTHTEYIKKGGE